MAFEARQGGTPSFDTRRPGQGSGNIPCSHSRVEGDKGIVRGIWRPLLDAERLLLEWQHPRLQEVLIHGRGRHLLGDSLV